MALWCRRVLCEWLQGEASSKGLAAIAASGAGAAVEAAAASERLEVCPNPSKTVEGQTNSARALL